MSLCELCFRPIESWGVEFDHQTLWVCPDGYDEDGLPRSGRLDEEYVAGKTIFRLRPCGCLVTKVAYTSGGLLVTYSTGHEVLYERFASPDNAVGPQT